MAWKPMVPLLTLLLGLFSCSAGGCSEGHVRIRLSNTSHGFIHPENSPYSEDTTCTWFLESDSSIAYMKLKFDFFATECLWDYLHIFSGDSIYSPKVAAYTGRILSADETTPPSYLGNGSIIGSGSGQGSEDVWYTPMDEIILTVNGPHLFFHFFSDLQQADLGFNISYWVSTCIANCSNNGQCQEDKGVCLCSEGWTGSYCHIPACPNSCSRHGNCINQQCRCYSGYTGVDCSLINAHPHWAVENVTDLDVNLLGRAGHTSVLWARSMWVFGGYQFNAAPVGFGSGSGQWEESPGQLLKYDIDRKYWEYVNPIGMRPHPRYGHSAVVYKDSMYIYGGALLPSEEIVNELWRFDFRTLSWTEIESCQSGNESTTTSYCPVGVKDHTANVVNDKMIVICGYPSFNSLLNYVQEFDFINESWPRPPPQYGAVLSNGLMAHSSVYVSETGLIYVYGGIINTQEVTLNRLYAYDPFLYLWKMISTSPSKQAFHSTLLMGGALVSYGGYTDSSCFSSELVMYDILGDEWRILSVPGLPGNASRYSYSAVTPSNASLLVYGGYRGQMHHDVLIFNKGQCSSLHNNVSCLDSLCTWTGSTCTDISLDRNNTTYCHLYISCSTCTNNTDCLWSDDKCISDSSFNSSLISCPNDMSNDCSHYTNCQSCRAHSGCGWWILGTVQRCTIKSNDTLSNAISCPATNECLSRSSCSSCTSSGTCLWCPSLKLCVPTLLYPYSFPFGQCLAWVSSCAGEVCADHQTCNNCRSEVGCGWCRDPADTGLGICSEGGFLSSQNESLCPDSHWFFDTCPLCNCNGHSECINKTICAECQDHTQGDNCENCEDGFYGRPINGQFCSVCDCNGYNPVCDNVHGNCTCLDGGVTGPQCTECRILENYHGNASNICYYNVRVGFIYTFITTSERQNFFVSTPSSGNRLNVKFELSQNPNQSTITVQFFLGRVMQNFRVLYNLTEPISLTGTNSYEATFKSFSSSSNSSNLFSFARPSIQSQNEFIWLLGNSSSDSYTNSLWNGDVSLVIYASDLKPSIRYKITVDQTDLIFLVYFFVTFLTCFTVLLSVFLFGWYIKRKLEIRALIRAQHIEMQRRVRRPFARIKALVEKPILVRPKQNASYVAVETVSDAKAAVLTLLVRLPSDAKTGYPKPNRTGICFGSTFVKMNPPKKSRLNKHTSSAPLNT